MGDKAARNLGEKKMKTLVLHMSIPSVLGMLMTAVYTMTDRIFLSAMVDKASGNTFAVSAMTVINPFTVVAFALLLLLSTGATSLISLYLGENRKEKAEKMLGNSLLLLLAGSLLLGGIGLLFKEPLLWLLGASENTYPLADEYFSVICCGVVFLAVSIGMASNIRSEGNAKVAFVTTALGAVLNVGLDPVFIGPLNMGVRGAAVATILSQAIAAVVVIGYYLSGKSVLRLRWKNLIPDFSLIGKSLWIGTPQFLLQMVASFIGVVYNRLLLWQGEMYGFAAKGDDFIAAYGMATMITQLFLMAVSGINNGVQPIFGYNYGAKKYARVQEAFLWAMVFATGILVLGFAVCSLFPRFLIGMFGGAQEAGEIAAFALRMQVLAWPVTAVALISPSYFQAVGKAVTANLLALSRQLLVLLPLLFLLSGWFGLAGIWCAAPAADVIAAGIAAVLMAREMRKLRAKIAQ